MMLLKIFSWKRKRLKINLFGGIFFILTFIIVSLIINIQITSSSSSNLKSYISNNDIIFNESEFYFNNKKEIINNILKKLTYAPLDSIKTHGKLDYKGHTITYKTTIDSILQYLSNYYLKIYHPKYAALVILDSYTGRIKALISYFNPDSGENSYKDYNFYMSNKFPAASIFKYITLYTYLTRHNGDINDSCFFVGRTNTLYRYQLKDTIYRYSRGVSLKRAYGLSINPVFGKIGYKLNNLIIDVAESTFFFKDTINFIIPIAGGDLIPIKKEYNYAELGSGFTYKTTLNPIQAALIYTAVVNKGYIPKPYLFEELKVDNKKVYSGEQEIIKSGLSKRALSEIEEASRYVIKRGTARRKARRLKYILKKYPNWVVGGKTGNINGKYIKGRTDWFVGFVYNKNNPYKENFTIAIVQVHGYYWTQHSSFIASEIIRRYIKYKEKEKSNVARGREGISNNKEIVR